MKKIICIVLALMMIAATATVLGGCGDDKSKSSSKTDATKATQAATTAQTSAPTAVLTTLAPTPTQAEVTEAGDEPTVVPDDDDDNTDAYYGIYGGLSGQDAILKALSYAGAGYQCVYYDHQYLRNQEAWYIGLQASEGTDGAVYYLYVNDNECVPVTEIPNIGGQNSGDSGIFSEDYAGISEQEAIFKALGMMEEEYVCVSSEAASYGGSEYWLIGIQKSDSDGSDIYYFYVNGDSCFAA